MWLVLIRIQTFYLLCVNRNQWVGTATCNRLDDRHWDCGSGEKIIFTHSRNSPNLRKPKFHCCFHRKPPLIPTLSNMHPGDVFTSLCLTCLILLILIKSTNHEAACYTVFSIPLLLCLSQVQVLSSAPCSHSQFTLYYPHRNRRSLTPTRNNGQNYCLVCFNIYVIKHESATHGHQATSYIKKGAGQNT
jgi:hypothetical protein